MFTQIGAAIGLLFCLYSLLFRLKPVIAKYGSISLYWWVYAVTVGCSILGFLADLAIWAVQDAIGRP